jgi:hypothetical protein
MRHLKQGRGSTDLRRTAPPCSPTWPAPDQARADHHHAAKAKELRPIVEKLVTAAKNGKGSLAARRSVAVADQRR